MNGIRASQPVGTILVTPTRHIIASLIRSQLNESLHQQLVIAGQRNQIHLALAAAPASAAFYRWRVPKTKTSV